MLNGDFYFDRSTESMAASATACTLLTLSITANVGSGFGVPHLRRNNAEKLLMIFDKRPLRT